MTDKNLDSATFLTDEQVERMVKDANFVGAHHPYAPLMHVDLCCHVRALASDRESLKLWIQWLQDEVKRLQGLADDGGELGRFMRL